jgi:hypothetical protein
MNLKVPQSMEYFDLMSNYQLFKKYIHHLYTWCGISQLTAAHFVGGRILGN